MSKSTTLRDLDTVAIGRANRALNRALNERRSLLASLDRQGINPLTGRITASKLAHIGQRIAYGEQRLLELVEPARRNMQGRAEARQQQQDQQAAAVRVSFQRALLAGSL